MSLPGALGGLRVLDLTRYIPGPYCTMVLADFGAEVVKVEEPPIGDPTRAVPPLAGEESAVHAALNRGKRSIVVDLRSEEGAAVVRRLAARADVLVEGFRPGTLARHGLGPQQLLEENPRLVYCSISGYGQDGPLAARAGHDVDYAALAGLLGCLRDAEGRPVLPSTQLADMSGALVSLLGILLALQARERTGRGQHVDASLFGGALALLTVPATRYLAGAGTFDELAGSYACYNVYRCRDGRFLAVGALEPKFWEALCGALGLPEKAGRQWERAPEKRRATVQAVADAFASRDRAEWLEVFATVDACVEPVLDMEEAVRHPELARRLIEQPVEGGVLRTVSPPVALAATPALEPRRAPGLGEDTRAVLGEAGYTSEEIVRMTEAGVVS